MPVREQSIQTDDEPSQRGESGDAAGAAKAAARGGAKLVAWLVATLIILGGIGWLYLLRDVDVLAVGPALRDALPLEQLAAHASQPLLRVVVAFVSSGAAAAVALALIGHVPARRRVVGLGLLATLLLVVDAILSAAIAQNEPVSKHVLPTLGHAGVWVEVACVVIGSSLAASVPPRGRPAPSAG